MKFLVSILIILGLLAPSLSNAAIPFNIGRPFGGRILSVQTCLCSATLLLTIGPPRGGVFILGPGSIIYLFYQVYRHGPWVLGTSSGTGVCLQPGNPCTVTGYGSIIRKIGTSLW